MAILKIVLHNVQIYTHMEEILYSIPETELLQVLVSSCRTKLFFRIQIPESIDITGIVIKLADNSDILEEVLLEQDSTVYFKLQTSEISILTLG